MAYLFDGINHPTVGQVQASGAVGCLMYGGTPGDGLGKDFTAAQYASYKAAGLLTVFVFENAANDMAGGMAAGAAHASALLADLHTKGVSSTEPVGATVDEHVSAANIPLAVQYQTGFYRQAAALGWAGARGGYGFAEFLVAIHDAGVADWYWGAGQRSLLPAYTNIWQDNTGTINVGGSADDRDWVLVPLPGGTVTTQDDMKAVLSGDWRFDTRNPVDMWRQTVATGFAIQASLAALAGALSTQDAAILAAVQGADADTKAGVAHLATAITSVSAGPTADVTALVSTLAGPLATALGPLLPPEMSPAQFIHLLAAELPAA